MKIGFASLDTQRLKMNHHCVCKDSVCKLVTIVCTQTVYCHVLQIFSLFSLVDLKN